MNRFKKWIIYGYLKGELIKGELHIDVFRFLYLICLGLAVTALIFLLIVHYSGVS